MAKSISTFRRLWAMSPKKAFAFMFKKVSSKAKKFIPRDEWNKNWLGEEMRPFNSLR